MRNLDLSVSSVFFSLPFTVEAVSGNYLSEEQGFVFERLYFAGEHLAW